MMIDGTISKDEYNRQRSRIDNEIAGLELKLKESTENTELSEDYDTVEIDIDKIRNTLETYIDFSKDTIDEEIVRKFVDQIIADDNNSFTLILNLQQDIQHKVECSVIGRKNKAQAAIGSSCALLNYSKFMSYGVLPHRQLLRINRLTLGYDYTII